MSILFVDTIFFQSYFWKLIVFRLTYTLNFLSISFEKVLKIGIYILQNKYGANHCKINVKTLTIASSPNKIARPSCNQK